MASPSGPRRASCRGLETERGIESTPLAGLAPLHREMLDLAPVGLFLCDREGQCVFVNRALAALFGVPVEQLLGAGWQEHLHPEDRAPVVAAWKDVTRPDGARGMEYRLLLADGRVCWVLGRAATLVGVGGEVSGFIGSLTNVDDRKRAEAEREELLASEQRSRRDAERASRTKDEFLATLSHELRTPLNAIVGWADILRTEGIEGEPARGALEAILRNALAQNQLIADLIDLTRIERGLVRLDLELCDPAAVAATALESLRPAAQAKGLSLALSTSPTRNVRVDPVRLRQVIWNLLSNAIKFARDGGSIEVSVAERDETALITVQDDGRGIDPDALPHLFERAWRGSSTARSDDGGLGLGLAIARELVELHSGTIEARSEGLGKGSTFTVRLPYPDDARDA